MWETWLRNCPNSAPVRGNPEGKIHSSTIPPNPRWESKLPLRTIHRIRWKICASPRKHRPASNTRLSSFCKIRVSRSPKPTHGTREPNPAPPPRLRRCAVLKPLVVGVTVTGYARVGFQDRVSLTRTPTCST